MYCLLCCRHILKEDYYSGLSTKLNVAVEQKRCHMGISKVFTQLSGALTQASEAVKVVLARADEEQRQQEVLIAEYKEEMQKRMTE